MSLPRGPVKIIVGGLIGVALLAAIFSLVGWRWGLFCAGLLAVEVYSFFNRYESDTISETIWEFSKRPLIPLLFGLGTGWAVTSHLIPATYEGVWTALLLGGLLGHFFFQRQEA